MWAEKDDGIIFQFNIQPLPITLFHITMPIVLIPLLISLLYFPTHNPKPPIAQQLPLPLPIPSIRPTTHINLPTN